MKEITHFFGWSSQKGLGSGLGLSLVFGLEDGCYMPMVVVCVDINTHGLSNRLDYTIKLKTYAEMTPSQLLEDWISGKWKQYDNDFRDMKAGAIILYALSASSVPGASNEGLFTLEIEYPVPCTQLHATICGSSFQTQGVEYATKTLRVHMPGGHQI